MVQMNGLSQFVRFYGDRLSHLNKKALFSCPNVNIDLNRMDLFLGNFSGMLPRIWHKFYLHSKNRTTLKKYHGIKPTKNITILDCTKGCFNSILNLRTVCILSIEPSRMKLNACKISSLMRSF